MSELHRVLANMQRRLAGRPEIGPDVEVIVRQEGCPRCAHYAGYAPTATELLCANCDHVLWQGDDAVPALPPGKNPMDLAKIQRAHDMLVSRHGKASKTKVAANSECSIGKVREYWDYLKR
jgi:hypothetical protein